MGHIGIPELLIIILILLLIFGAKRLPEIGQALAKAIKEFKKAGQDKDKDESGSDNKDITHKD